MVANDTRLPELVVIEPAEQAGRTLPLSEPQIVIGHSDAADFVIDDPFVSEPACDCHH